ncbi:MAG: response regulator [Chitinophagaceae bacterium]
MSSPAKILVVDDDEEIGIMLQMILEHKGFSVIILKRTEQAEETMSRHTISLVILDMLIAGVKGTDVCMRLKANSNTAHIPVMMITALPEAEEICKQAGADDFLNKPFELDSLITKINLLLNKILI